MNLIRICILLFIKSCKHMQCREATNSQGEAPDCCKCSSNILYFDSYRYIYIYIQRDTERERERERERKRETNMYTQNNEITSLM